MLLILNKYIYKIVYIYILTACVAQLARDTQAVGHEFEPHLDH